MEKRKEQSGWAFIGFFITIVFLAIIFTTAMDPWMRVLLCAVWGMRLLLEFRRRDGTWWPPRGQ